MAAHAIRCILHEPSPKEVLYLNFAVTYRCNSRCKMCSIWQRYRLYPHLVKEEMGLGSITAFAESTYLRHLAGVDFTGGEAFLRSDFVDIVGLFIDRHPNAVYGIATNGLKTELTVDKVKEIEERFNPKSLSVSLSLDGLAVKHDEIRGIDGAYEAVTETIERLKDETSVNIGIDFTITPWNYRELLPVYRYTKEREIKFLTGFAHRSDAYYRNSTLQLDWNDVALRGIEEDLQAIVRDKEKRTTLSHLVDPYAYFFSHCVSCYKDQRSPVRCYSGTHSLFLDPYGGVYPCIMLDCSMGNVNDGGFERAWFSAQATQIREYIRGGACSCWVACEAVPSLVRNLTFLKWNIQNTLHMNS